MDNDRKLMTTIIIPHMSEDMVVFYMLSYLPMFQASSISMINTVHILKLSLLSLKDGDIFGQLREKPEDRVCFVIDTIKLRVCNSNGR